MSLFASIKGKTKNKPPGYFEDTANPDVIVSMQIRNKVGLFLAHKKTTDVAIPVMSNNVSVATHLT